MNLISIRNSNHDQIVEEDSSYDSESDGEEAKEESNPHF